jgi:hypothetical protein
MNAEELCVSNDSKKIYPFLKEVYSLKFDEEPNYNKLSFILVKELMQMNISPSKDFDWIKPMPSPSNQLSHLLSDEQRPSTPEFNEMKNQFLGMKPVFDNIMM